MTRLPVVAWGVSLALLALRAFCDVPFVGGETAHLDLALVVWVALGTFPCPAHRSRGVLSFAADIALFLGPIGLAVGLDARSGLDPWLAEHGSRLAIGAALFLLLRASGRLGGAGGIRARAIAAWGWLIVVPGWAALEAALGFVARGTAAPGGPVRLASPVGWCGVEGAGAGAAFVAAGALLFLVAAVGRADRGRAR